MKGSTRLFNLVTIILVIGCQTAMAQGNAEKLKIGVIEFEERSPIGMANASKILPEILAEALVKVGVYEVTERLLIGKILEEQELALSGIIAPSNAAAIGKIYGLDAIVIGTFMKVGDSITISMRLVDTSTGKVRTASTLKLGDINTLEAQLEIAGYELSGFSREQMKIIKEDALKDKFRAGVSVGPGIGIVSEYIQGSSLSPVVGIFFSSKAIYFDLLAMLPFAIPPLSLEHSVASISAGTGVYLGRYFGLGAGFNYFVIEATQDADPVKVYGEFAGIYLNARIRPTVRMAIDIGIGGSLGTVSKTWNPDYTQYDDDRLFNQFPIAPMILSFEYYFDDNWGIKAFFLFRGSDGVRTVGTGEPDTNWLSGFATGLLVSYSFAF
ncbi:MAG: hypothetical protein CVV51_11930 [Spirochaetae bacterium HGW-Spirochaetae-7]|jgi:hypothetical protein|nr:MAG: hypothetical protein CVV51_11930 [Spirochaetae bacterium HGW-Spirochaetae-7]